MINPQLRAPDGQIYLGDSLAVLKELPDSSAHCCITSPPYYLQRDYRVAGQIGIEKSVDEYVDKLTAVFRELRRVLHPTGTLWLNMGDSYAGSGGEHKAHHRNDSGFQGKQAQDRGVGSKGGTGLKDKDLMGVPWRLALALQADGWYLRSDIIWEKVNCIPECLDPETRVFIRRGSWVSRVSLEQVSQLSELPEILGPHGWVKIKSLWRTRKEAIKIEAAKVERVICSAEHRFPLSSERRAKSTRLEKAKDVRHQGYADYFLYCPIDKFLHDPVLTSWMGHPLDHTLGFLIGVYAAEGGIDQSRVRLTIGLSETDFAEKIRKCLLALGLPFSEDVDRNSIRFGFTPEWAERAIATFVHGTVKTKALAIELIINAPCDFRHGILDGYLAGDGSKRSYKRGGPSNKKVVGWSAVSASRRLRDDIATLASSLGIITSKGYSENKDERTEVTSHSHAIWTPYTSRKEKSGTEGVYQVPPRRRRSLGKERDMIDLEVDGGLFLIGDGLITHNSVLDRPTKSHEYVFLMSKSPRYFYDVDAIREPSSAPPVTKSRSGFRSSNMETYGLTVGTSNPSCSHPNGRNARTVWRTTGGATPRGHYATFPLDLIKPMIVAGTSEKGCCPNPKCGAQWTRVVERENTSTKTDKWEPSCEHDSIAPIPSIIIDPFAGSGTTLMAARRLGRRWVGIDLSPTYIAIIKRRIESVALPMALF